MIPFLLFILLPFAEIAVFLGVADEIGFLRAFLLCLCAAVFGAYLIARQGLRTIADAQDAFLHRTPPVQEIFDGICTVLAGVLLIVPGFITDFFALLLLIPGARQSLRLRYGVANSADPAAATKSRDDIIDAEYEIIEDNIRDKP